MEPKAAGDPHDQAGPKAGTFEATDRRLGSISRSSGAEVTGESNDPRDGGKGSGGGGGDGYESGPPIESAKLAMWVLLCSLAMLFLGFTSAYVVLRSGAPSWPPPGLPALPPWLWVSTAVIALSAFTMHTATASLKKGKVDRLKAALFVTAILGLLFLALQVFIWKVLVDRGLSLSGSIYAANFYALTGLHGVHVLGGVGLLLYVLFEALRNRYSSGRRTGVEICAMYWHFVGGIWIFLFGMLYLIE